MLQFFIICGIICTLRAEEGQLEKQMSFPQTLQTLVIDGQTDGLEEVYMPYHADYQGTANPKIISPIVNHAERMKAKRLRQRAQDIQDFTKEFQNLGL